MYWGIERQEHSPFTVLLILPFYLGVSSREWAYWLPINTIQSFTHTDFHAKFLSSRI